MSSTSLFCWPFEKTQKAIIDENECEMSRLTDLVNITNLKYLITPKKNVYAILSSIPKLHS